MSGPPPKRDAARRRRNKPTTETITVDLSEALAGTVDIPAPPTKWIDRDEDGEDLDPEDQYEGPKWHPVAERWYLSLTRSGQAIFYEPSDWETAYLLADQIDRQLSPKPVQSGTDDEGNPTFTWMPVPMPGAALNAILKGMSALMATEGDRRKSRIELDRQKARDAAGAEPGKVIPISQQRAEQFR